jgi:ligand-binding sensor domain-containing protein/serine phosphatase RsbU (regulator of sigma subunit)
MQNANLFSVKKVSIILLFSISSMLDAQDYFFKNYTRAQDGIASTIYDIIQDEDHFIWMGTNEGLYKYDGHEFEVFTSETDSLASNQIKSLYLHSSGEIWMGHWNGGISRLKDRKFQTIRNTSKLQIEDIVDIQEDIDGSLWFATQGSGAFYIKDIKAEHPKIENLKGGALGSLVFDITLLKDSTLLFNTELYIAKYNRDSGNFDRFEFPGTNYAHKYTLLEDQQGFIWIGTHNDGLFKYNLRNNSYAHYDAPNDGLETNIVIDLFQDSKGYIWASNIDEQGLNGGITRILGSNVTVFNKENGLIDNRIQCVFEDIEGNILIGTNENGLSIFKGQQFEIFNIEDQSNNKPGIINNQVYAFYEDENNDIWFGTDGGISVYNANNNSFKHYTYTRNGINNEVRSIVGNSKQIWVGTKGGGLFRFDPNHDNFKPIYLANFGWANNNLVTHLAISDEHLFVGTTSGLIKYNYLTKSEIRLNDVEYGLCGNNIESIYIDSKKRVWVGAVNSGVSYSENQQDFRCISLLADLTPSSFVEDKSGNIWVGTNQGVYVLKNDSTIIQHINANTGLLSNRVTSLSKTERGDIFIGTILGIHKYNPKDSTLKAFNEYNGFPGIEAKQGAAFTDSKGNIWIGSAQGAVKYIQRFDDAEIIEPLTQVSKVLVNLEEQEFYDGIKLKHNENKIHFYYTSINLSNPKSVRYRIMLDGLDEKWQPITDQRVSQYEALPPGKYNFKLLAKNSFGIWNKEPVQIQFTIKPPFWQTWWFILIVIVLAGAGITLYIRIREQNLIREKKVLEDKVKERTIELSDANAELAMKNKDITDSIQYAKRIQFSILPPEIPFSETFVLFKPKDIVSGDFYWITQKDEHELIAAVDCTGHGVPGAFMSFIGYTSLNKIVLENGVVTPSEILNQLDDEVVKALHQNDDDDVKDGMDLSLIKFDNKQRKLEFAGAYNSIYVVRGEELIEHKADRFAIGRSFVTEKNFTNKEVELQSGDMVYMYSDGYADQFGGKDGKKFRSKPFKQLLVSIASKPAEEQKEILDKTIEDWRGEIEQIDDILVVGRRF